MKMFESVDTPATRSGRDLWAEICPCLPNPDQEDAANNAFSDSFVDSHRAGGGQREAASFPVQPAVKPWAPLQDSEVYLASLGKLHLADLSLSQKLVVWGSMLKFLYIKPDFFSVLTTCICEM